ncbi:MAG: NUDIX hydrolase [Methanobacteriaceae archaeon]|nr:NUDIX hydrolase [Methanobacteriaceae archaeon]
MVLFLDNKSIILIKRKNKPFRGYWALPGGFVDYGETVESAVIREAKEETGLDINIEGIIGIYSNPERDPRGHVVSICFLGSPDNGKLKADTDASEVKVFKLEEINSLDLAFDHEKIIKDAIKLII